MNNQVIVSISREFGSGGHEIARLLAESLGVKLYDRNILAEISHRTDLSYEKLIEYDEKHESRLFNRRIYGMSTSIAESLQKIEEDYLLEKAESGESFVIVGRCSDWVLREYPGLIRIFIYGTEKHRTQRTMQLYGLSEQEARKMNRTVDDKRKAYHDSTVRGRGKWGEPETYYLCVDSAPLGIEGTASMLNRYVRNYEAELELKPSPAAEAEL